MKVPLKVWRTRLAGPLNVFIILLLPALAPAHPGHAPDDVPPPRLFISAEHYGGLLGVSVLSFCFIQAWRWPERS